MGKEEEIHSVAQCVEELSAQIRKLTRDVAQHKPLQKNLQGELETIKKECKNTVIATDELSELRETCGLLKMQRASVTEQLKCSNDDVGVVCYDVSKVRAKKSKILQTLTGKQCENRSLQLKVNTIYQNQQLSENQISRVCETQETLKDSIARGLREMGNEFKKIEKSAVEYPKWEKLLADSRLIANREKDALRDEYEALRVEETEITKESVTREFQIKELEKKITDVLRQTERFRAENQVWHRRYNDLCQNKDWVARVSEVPSKASSTIRSETWTDTPIISCPKGVVQDGNWVKAKKQALALA